MTSKTQIIDLRCPNCDRHMTAAKPFKDAVVSLAKVPTIKNCRHCNSPVVESPTKSDLGATYWLVGGKND